MKQELLQLAYNLDTIDAAVQQFWQVLGNHKIFAFSGEMSAGKTTFIHKLCDYLQVEDTVSSPTFSLINEYHYPQGVIFHMDWYRLKSTEEAISAGIEDCLLQAGRTNAKCFVEWPEKAPEILPKYHLWLSIETTSETERVMTVSVVE